jgi:hypothetical protein
MKKILLNPYNVVAILIIFLLGITTITGVFSFGDSHKYEFTNLYGDVIEIYGGGLYKNDSFFKAPISIGTDFTIILTVIPMILCLSVREIKTTGQKIKLFSILGIVLYYASSISFGVTYNELHLIYIVLLGISFFAFFILLLQLYKDIPNNCNYQFIKGEKTFIIVCGLTLFIAWLPDILSSLLSNSSLNLIEVYTTEITYVLDMGIISPLIFIIYYLLRKQQSIGIVLYHMLLTVLQIIGVMLPLQTLIQRFAGISIPLAALVTKVGIFLILALCSFYFKRNAVNEIDDILKKEIRNETT